MAKKVNPQAKAKRQKIIAAIGGVLLLGLLAFQVPRTMKLLHQSNANAAQAQTTSSVSAGTTPTATATLGGSTSTGAATSADGLTDPNGAVSPQAGQLVALSRFRSKDPFAQQLNLNCGGETTTNCSSGGSRTGSQGGSTGAAGPTDTGTGTGTGNSLPPVVKAKSAVISVNGRSETVQVGAAFPASNPTFVLVSLSATKAKVAIANGSLEGSKQTVTLKKNVPLTLMNTVDGTRYVLRLVSVG